MELEKIRRIVSEVLDVAEDEISLDTRFIEDLGADSLDIFQIILGIEEEFDIEITNEEVEKIICLGDAIARLKMVSYTK